MSILKFYILGGHLAFYATWKDITNQFPYITVRFRIQKTVLQIFISAASSYLSPFCKFRSTSTTISPRLGYWDWYMSCRLEWISSFILFPLNHIVMYVFPLYNLLRRARLLRCTSRQYLQGSIIKVGICYVLLCENFIFSLICFSPNPIASYVVPLELNLRNQFRRASSLKMLFARTSTAILFMSLHLISQPPYFFSCTSDLI